MKNSNYTVVSLIIGALLYITCAMASAVEPIKVHLAVGSGVLPSRAVTALDQANDVMAVGENLPGHKFESAAMAGGTPIVSITSCSGTNQTGSQTLVNCAVNKLATQRENLNADVVMMVVNNMNGCGGAHQAAINADSISQRNAENAYVVVKQSCITNPVGNQQVAAHELGHVLSLEHWKIGGTKGDPQPTIPIPFNHAAKGFGDNVTVMGAPVIDCTNCNWHSFFSKAAGRLFPNGDDAGNPSRSDARRVIIDYSWNTVAHYRPITLVPAVPTCPPPLFQGCNAVGEASWLISWNPPSGAQPTEWIMHRSFDDGNKWIQSYRGVLEQITCAADDILYRIAYVTPTRNSQYRSRHVFRHCIDPPPTDINP